MPGAKDFASFFAVKNAHLSGKNAVFSTSEIANVHFVWLTGSGQGDNDREESAEYKSFSYDVWGHAPHCPSWIRQ